MVLRRREAISIPAWFGNWPRQRLPVLVGSDAARTLEDAMRRYVSGEVSGRSFLIAGHRGAGTTTLVRRVAERITDEIFDHLVNLAKARIPPQSLLGMPPRPLLVRVQGTSDEQRD